MEEATSVIVVGGGPAGLCLAIELGMRGVNCMVFDDKPDTTPHPQANATQARTMEHFRRMGFADEIRALGLPRNYPTDIAYFTRYTKHELGRFRMPASGEVRDLARQATGAWSSPERPHRCSQMFIERVLKKHAGRYPSVSLRYGWRVTGFKDHGTHVTADAEPTDRRARTTIKGAYIIGCDGPRSLVRQALGIRYGGEGSAARHFMGGTMLAAYFRQKDLYRLLNGDKAWMYWTFNADRRALMAAINGSDEFVYHTQLRADEADGPVSPARAQALFEQGLGCACPIEVLYTARWNAGYTLVADSYRQGRAFIAGDAAHLFTPTGGLGYNTAVEDAVNLGWKLAAVLQGWGGARLVETYQEERRPAALRNTRIARAFADSVGKFAAHPQLEEDSAEGAAARAAAGAYLTDHARREFNIPGVTFGVRYDGSSIIASDGPAPPDSINDYVPTGVPGGRAPHLWLDDASLYDRFGRDFTLLVMRRGSDVAKWGAAARALGLPLTVLDISRERAAEEARYVYGADLALIRPDQHVAWRGAEDTDPEIALQRSIGQTPA
ncbi:MAG TPA: FAD-dependent oxidoreductase [Alphaproteobacteria bacterium]|nr:FAD-dependent oxidoreductase [Alphaproteobacteria bacterium]